MMPGTAVSEFAKTEASIRSIDVFDAISFSFDSRISVPRNWNGLEPQTVDTSFREFSFPNQKYSPLI